MEKHADGRKVGVKISPVPDTTLPLLVAAIVGSGVVDEVVAVNTIPDQQLKKSDGSPALSYLPPGGKEKLHTGGLAGEPLRKEGLRVVRQLWELLPPDIQRIGCGGIFSGAHLALYLNADVDGIECATAYLGHGKPNPRIFSDILQEYTNISEPTLEDYVGQDI